MSGRMVLRRAAILVWAGSLALVVFGSLTPTMAIPSRLLSDKLVHCAAYAWLAFLPSLFLGSGRRVLAACLGLAVMGGAIELIQGFVPGRMPSLADMAANLTGLALGFLCGILLIRSSVIDRRNHFGH